MIIEQKSKYFPEELKKIERAPEYIYAEGNIELLNKKGIAVVGSRNCTQYGEKMCKNFIKDLTEYQLNIVSGLAKGIDSISHESCINFNGSTIAVLPGGLNKIYPKENKRLVQEILEHNGLIISEYEDNVEACSNNFIRRNLIISTITIGTLIVEAGYRSGTSITAKYARKQGKSVFCIPSSLENKKGITTNKMIQKGEAKLVINVNDIINEYKDIKWEKIKHNNIFNNIEDERNQNISLKEKVYNCLSFEPIDAEDISDWINEPIKEVNCQLMLLEIQGKIKMVLGGKYILNE